VTRADSNAIVRIDLDQEMPMNRYPTPEPPAHGDDSDEEFDAWSLDDLDGLADGHSQWTSAPHDGDD
jgi:hypothetical protein